MALSSTRIISTCALMGQAVGTAAKWCLEHNISPRVVGKKYINALQEQLLRDDSYIPNRPANDINDKAPKASLMFASSTLSGDVKNLINGVGRAEIGKDNHWQSNGHNVELHLEWIKRQKLNSVEIKFDTNLQRKIMMHKNPAKNKNQVIGVPPELVKDFLIEARDRGQWKEVGKVKNNLTRLVKVSFDEIETTAIRIKLENTHGDPNIKLFEVRCY